MISCSNSRSTALYLNALTLSIEQALQGRLKTQPGIWTELKVKKTLKRSADAKSSCKLAFQISRHVISDIACTIAGVSTSYIEITSKIIS